MSNDTIRIGIGVFADICAQNVRLRDKLLEIAKACTTCGGTGVVTFAAIGGPTYQHPCDDCEDIRETLR